MALVLQGSNCQHVNNSDGCVTFPVVQCKANVVEIKFHSHVHRVYVRDEDHGRLMMMMTTTIGESGEICMRTTIHKHQMYIWTCVTYIANMCIRSYSLICFHLPILRYNWQADGTWALEWSGVASAKVLTDNSIKISLKVGMTPSNARCD